MKAYIKLIDNIPYFGTEQWYDVIIDKEQWDSLDKSLLYTIDKGELALLESVVKENQQPIPTVLPPMPLSMMLEKEGCGINAKVNALWDVVVKQERTAIDEFVKKESEVRKEHERLTQEYEASK